MSWREERAVAILKQAAAASERLKRSDQPSAESDALQAASKLASYTEQERIAQALLEEAAELGMKHAGAEQLDARRRRLVGFNRYSLLQARDWVQEYAPSSYAALIKKLEELEEGYLSGEGSRDLTPTWYAVDCDNPSRIRESTKSEAQAVAWQRAGVQVLGLHCPMQVREEDGTYIETYIDGSEAEADYRTFDGWRRFFGHPSLIEIDV